MNDSIIHTDMDKFSGSFIDPVRVGNPQGTRRKRGTISHIIKSFVIKLLFNIIPNFSSIFNLVTFQIGIPQQHVTAIKYV